jgi:hypothetical protein
MGPTYSNIAAIINLQSSIMEQTLEKLQQPLLLAPPLIALIRHQRQPWQLMQLDTVTRPALEVLAIGVT